LSVDTEWGSVPLDPYRSIDPKGESASWSVERRIQCLT
jgi:hypothetical protein